MTAEQIDFAQVWSSVVEHVDTSGIAPRDRAFLRLTRLVGLLDSTALLAVPYEHTKDTLETTLRLPVVQALTHQLGQEVRLAITVDADLRRQVEDEGKSSALSDADQDSAADVDEMPEDAPESGDRTH
ncbi:MAG: hypothetical protein WA880_13195, partial [Ornithinimicrobium sp.]